MNRGGTRLKVLVISKFDGIGGVNNALRRLCELLALAGEIPTLMFIRGSDPQVPGYGFPVEAYLTGRRARASQVIGLPWLRFWMANAFPDSSAPDPASWFLAPLRRLKKSAFDVVILGDENLATFSYLACTLRSTPFLIFSHEGRLSSLPILHSLQTRMYARCRGVLVQSPLALALLTETSRRPVHLIQLATHFRDAPILPKERFILFDTRWTPNRNPNLILDILDLESRISATVAGSFSTDELRLSFERQVANRGLSGRITFALNRTDDEIRNLYARALAYLRWPHMHRGEQYELGIGWGVVTALENGCPVVLDESLGGSRLVKNGVHGYLVSGNATSFARAVASLLDDPAQAEMFAWNALSFARETVTDRSLAGLREVIERAGDTRNVGRFN